MSVSTKLKISGMIALAAFAAAQANSELILETLVVELNDGDDGVEDIEIYNSGDERQFVSVEAAFIEDPGLTNRRVTNPDPEALGMLASPGKAILEPGERRLIRLANLSDEVENEKVYRVLVRPVPPIDEPTTSGLNIMVGYDVLVLVRPEQISRALHGRIDNGVLTLQNDGNASVELLKGTQCRAENACTDIPGKRLYSGQSYKIDLDSGLPVDFVVRYADGVKSERFS